MRTPEWPHEYICLYREQFGRLRDQVGHGGYLVYRRAFDEAKCGLERGAEAHRVAIFVTESEASNYCDYRNAMTIRLGTDDTDGIRFPEITNPSQEQPHG